MSGEFISERIKRCGQWWNGADEAERFLLYYTCLRENYEMPASLALETARNNWKYFGPSGDLIGTLRREIAR
jgi:hypothetical protein